MNWRGAAHTHTKNIHLSAYPVPVCRMWQMVCSRHSCIHCTPTHPEAKRVRPLRGAQRAHCARGIHTGIFVRNAFTRLSARPFLGGLRIVRNENGVNRGVITFLCRPVAHTFHHREIIWMPTPTYLPTFSPLVMHFYVDPLAANNAVTHASYASAPLMFESNFAKPDPNRTE